jgi:hypothetical protein
VESELSPWEVETDGTVWAWAVGWYGQLGDGSFYQGPLYGMATPVQVSGSIAAGYNHILALPAVCTEPPAASYAVVKTPAPFANPPRIVGWFQLLATDDCDPDPLIYLKGNARSFVAGPFHHGDQGEIAHGPSLIPQQAPSTFGGNVATIQLNGDVLLWAVDSKGNASAPIKCK